MDNGTKKWFESQPIAVNLIAKTILDGEEAKHASVGRLCREIEAFIRAGHAEEKVKLPLLATSTATSDEARILSIGNIEGVDKLKPKKPLKFQVDGLTVIYGRNGSGKTGYTRLIKRAAGHAGSAKLISDVFRPQQAKHSAEFTIQVGDQQNTSAWKEGDDPLEVLNGISVYESRLGRFRIETDHTLSFEPEELALYKDLAEYCDVVRNAFNSQIKESEPKLPAFPERFSKSRVSKHYAELVSGDASNSAELLKTFDEKEKSVKSTLVSALSVQNPLEQAKTERNEAKKCQELAVALGQAVQSISPVSISEFKDANTELKHCQLEAKEVAKVLESDDLAGEVSSDTWRTMFFAAKEYSEDVAYSDHDFPFIGKDAKCVLCHQALDENAKQRMSSFNDYVIGQASQLVKNSRDEVQKYISKLPDASEHGRLRILTTAAGLDSALEEQVSVLLDSVEVFVENLSKSKFGSIHQNSIGQGWPEYMRLLEDIKSGEEDYKDVAGMDHPVVAELLILEKKFEAQAAIYEKAAKGTKREASEKQLKELEALEWIAEHRSEIETRIKWVNDKVVLENCKKQLVTNKITTRANQRSKVIVSKAYTDQFKKELEDLGAEDIDVKLQSKPVKGKLRFSIELIKPAQDKKAALILSDGEKQIVSFAAFLAELECREANHTVILDDPISSLDVDYEEELIRRLANLARSRQVIVFTHRLNVVSLFLDVCKEKEYDGKDPRHVEIRAEMWGKGESYDGPPSSAQKIIKKLKKLQDESLPQALKLLSKRSEEYTLQAKAICSSVRDNIEFLIESLLTSGVVKRHSRNIATKQVMSLSKITREDCSLIESSMSFFSKHSHSQSIEADAPPPKPERLAIELKKLIIWAGDFDKKDIPKSS
ncbi:AAA family ATPase [Planctomycetota bacterium]|nr:AAA family ATPase [Planctomycetota bacterium]